MAFSDKPIYLLTLMISTTFVLFASALDDSNNAPEVLSWGSGGDGFLPLAKKHVIIHNILANGETLDAHCKSSETDFGLIHIPWNSAWGFRFHVNFTKSTKFRCHFTWYGCGSHYFNIFKVSRDDNPFGRTPVCKECIWEVGKNDEYPMCRINHDGESPYCFKWDDNL